MAEQLNDEEALNIDHWPQAIQSGIIEMGTRSGSIGNILFEFDYDDTSLEILSVRCDNPDNKAVHFQFRNPDGEVKFDRDINGNFANTPIPPPQRAVGERVIIDRHGVQTEVLQFYYTLDLANARNQSQ